MSYQRLFYLVMLVTVLSLSLSCTKQIDPKYQAELDSWHDERLANLMDEDGWLTLVGLFPIKNGDNTIGSGQGMDIQLPENGAEYLGVLRVNKDSMVFKAGNQVTAFIEGERRKEVINRRLW